ncbi:MAG: hypothetical protein WCK31_04415 [bacterium]
MLVFDPIQLKSFGHEYFETDTFSVRYVLTKKLIFKSIYIPYGPVIKTEKGLQDFIDFLWEGKLNKIKIDLPKIYSSEIQNIFITNLKQVGFKPSEYIQDGETLVLNKGNWDLKSRYQRYVRSSSKDFSTTIYDNITDDTLNENTSNPILKDLYKIYYDNGHELGYNIKPYEIFKDTFCNSITIVANFNETKEISGFLMGYKYNSKVIDNITSNDLLLLFTALTETGKQHKVGYLIHQKLFEHAFNELNYDSIDFHGADRSKKRSYIEFKERFGGTFVSYPGSFEYKKYF